MDFVVCYVHNKKYPRSTCHDHHITPRASGGLDYKDNLVWLCANCHTLLHRCIQLYTKGKKGLANDLAEQSYDVPVIRQRFMSLVKDAVDAASIAQAFGLKKAKALCSLELDHDVYHKLKILAYERKEKGRRVGITRYIEVILIDHLRKKGLLEN